MLTLSDADPIGRPLFAAPDARTSAEVAGGTSSLHCNIALTTGYSMLAGRQSKPRETE
jgi:hypothetical protein